MELNKEVLDCMKALRRRLREEQAVDIRLSQVDAISAMLDGSLKSDDEETRRLGQRLAELSDQPQRATVTPLAAVELPVGTPTGSVRVYRGQRIYA
ncbi:hypothetical protein L0Y47_05925 [Ectopseudomonas composti]|jgi:chemotaxis protein histidine kinase CheA|uniref:Uncharacterized protein n=1 Tax=Ectopseudomonas composti TaxID=658457 RepID=A0A1I5N4E3_9GAMM|nr:MULTISPECIES: hypothetical protein [Pseudomonas]EZH83517.1 hypothetical protein AU05_22775 [Pseudomonas composti]MDN5514690.1 hypothetical protein [Pseudomonas sp.]QNH05597.1 hypothetical protein HNQ27_23490 [Pseudomonas sp. B11D7D]SFP16492.1 hypothetical protein SAMN05216601_10670 [Pseudomonas composti]